MAKPRLLNMCGKIVPYEDRAPSTCSSTRDEVRGERLRGHGRAYWSDADQQLYVFRPGASTCDASSARPRSPRIPLPADAAARLERETLRDHPGPTSCARICTCA